MNLARSKSLLRVAALSALLFAAPAFAGPPLLCHPFHTAGAPSLPWGGSGWNSPRKDYDVATRLSAETLALLGANTAVIARMETLRRAAIYASRDGAAMRDLAAKLDARIAAAKDANAKALALFDAGYFAETVQEIGRLQEHRIPGTGLAADADALRAVQAGGDGSLRIAAALKLRPDDAGLRFAAALVAAADQRQSDYALHARLARAAAGADRLLALNIGQIAD